MLSRRASPLNSVEGDVSIISPHNPPISTPASQIDTQLYEGLCALEEELLAVVPSDNDTLIDIYHRWIDLQSRVQLTQDGGQLGEETLELYESVRICIAILCNALLEGEARREEVEGRLSDRLTNLFDSEPTLIPKPPKSQQQRNPSPRHKKPPLQSKRTPTEISKTPRKRRADVGIPGQESLKFRPCRDFFMEHLSDPYPNFSQKQELMRTAGISPASLNQWFTNTRRRSGWMDIMKDHANGRKEDMKLLVERSLAPLEAGLPSVSEHVMRSIKQMRQYVDELAREVVSPDFLSLLEQLRSISEGQALKYQDELRAERKKRQLTRTGSMDEDTEEGDCDDDYQPALGVKRKRTNTPINPTLLKGTREATTLTSLDVLRTRTKHPRASTPPFTETSIRYDQSPPGGSQVSINTDDNPLSTPDPSRRRTTTVERHQPLSNASTLVEGLNIDLYGLSSSRQIPITQEIAVSYDDDKEFDWPNGISAIVISAPVDDLSENSRENDSTPYHFKFSASAYTDASIKARNVAVTEWAKTMMHQPSLNTPPRLATNDDFWNEVALSKGVIGLPTASPAEVAQSREPPNELQRRLVSSTLDTSITQQGTEPTFQEQQQPFCPDQKVEPTANVHLQRWWEHDGYDPRYSATSTMQESFIPQF